MLIASLLVKAKMLDTTQMPTRGELTDNCLFQSGMLYSNANNKTKWMSFKILIKKYFRHKYIKYNSIQVNLKNFSVIEITPAFWEDGKKLGDGLTAEAHRNTFWVIKYLS